MSLSLPSVLVVDDERNMRLTVQALLEGEGYAVRTAESAERALELLEKEESFLVVTDAQMGGMSGYDFLRELHRRRPEMPTLMITAYATPKLAVEAIKAGAIDYLGKPFAPEELLLAVSRCAERHQLLAENAALRARAGEAYSVERIIGDCPSMQDLRRMIRTVAPTNATVLILGESGTGKELVAGAIHALSQRRAAPYVRINCAAIPDALLESELFGHEKGAFTGAVKQKLGRVEEADGGTIFLDEIGDMSRPLQAKLLRFLEDGTFTRVGGNEELKVNVRLIAATNRDVIQAIRDNQFREDLYHRLNVVQFRPPALRERSSDVPLLAQHFLRQFNAAIGKSIHEISKAAAQNLQTHHWPGNVRELRNVIERAVILEGTGEIQPQSLPDFKLETGLRKAGAAEAPADLSLDECLAKYERELILSALERHQNSVGKAADQLKMTRHALRYRLQRLNLHIGEGEEGESAPAKEA